MDLDLIIDEEENEIPYNKQAKEELRKQLNIDIDVFLTAGGNIQFIPSEYFAPAYKRVGNFREGITGSSYTLSKESL